MLNKKGFLVLITFAACLTLIITGCGRVSGNRANSEPSGDSLSLEIYPGMVELPKDENLKLLVRLSGENLDNEEMEWSTSDSDVVEVSEDGVIFAVAEGEAVIEAVLAKNKKERASCSVIVTTEGPILLYVDDIEDSDAPDDFYSDPDPDYSPDLHGGGGGEDEGNNPEPPGEEANPEPDSEPDNSIPVEHDPEIDIPVEVIPELDEFIWTIRVRDKVEEEYPEIKAKLVVELDLTVTKEGGKNAYGVYSGTANITYKMDTSQMTEDLIDESGGKILFSVDIGGDLTDENLKMNLDRYDSIMMKNYNGGVPITSLTESTKMPGWKMALGEMHCEGEGGFGYDFLDAEGREGHDDKDISGGGNVVYKLFMDSVGKVHVRLPQLLKQGDAFKGKITKRPYIPD